MAKLFERLNDKKARDLRVLADFISIYCREKHLSEEKESVAIPDGKAQQALGGGELLLCSDCRRLFSHGMAKLLLCPYDPKPMCKKCETHCYAPGYREKIREVMRFSGTYLIKHGRLDLMAHYWL